VLDADMILTALAAGASAGVTTAGSSMITDAYNGLKSLIRRKLAAAGQPDEVLDGTVDPARARHALNAAGIPGDREIVAAYHQIRALLDQSATHTVINSGTVNGAAGTFQGPVTIHNVPHGWPGATDPR
jgi:hypothetical protein